MKSLSVAFKYKILRSTFLSCSARRFIMLYKVILTIKSVDETVTVLISVVLFIMRSVRWFLP